MEERTLISLIILITFITLISVVCCVVYHAESLVSDVDQTIQYTQVKQDDNEDL